MQCIVSRSLLLQRGALNVQCSHPWCIRRERNDRFVFTSKGEGYEERKTLTSTSIRRAGHAVEPDEHVCDIDHGGAQRLKHDERSALRTAGQRGQRWR